MLARMEEERRLHPAIRWVWTVGSGIPALVVVAGAAVVDVALPPPFGVLTVPVLVVAGAAAWWLPALRYRSWGYTLRSHDLLLRFGVVTKVQRRVPRTRVQHVDLIGGPVERALGLRRLKIYTAGTREADVSIPGLPVAEAERLRDELLSWVAIRTPSGPPASVPPADD